MAKDIYHEIVKIALVKDGWTITDDPAKGGNCSMDRIEEYSQLIQNILEHHASIPYSHGEIQSYAIADLPKKHFMLMIVGWDGKQRVHGCITHVQIIDGKIWIQRDGIEEGITDELVEAGVPKSDIVLGFHPLDVRPHTGYAIA